MTTLRVAYFSLPPHAVQVDGRHVGPAIEYFDLVAAEMGVKATYVQLPLSRLVIDSKGDFDAVLFLGRNPEREAIFTFASQPLMELRGAIAVLNESRLNSISSSQDLIGMEIGVYKDGYLSPLIRDPRVHTFKMPSETLVRRGLQMVARKRIDGFYCPDDNALRVEIEALELAGQIRLVELPKGNDALFTAFTKGGALRYLEVFEAAVRRVRQTVSYEQLLERSINRRGLVPPQPLRPELDARSDERGLR